MSAQVSITGETIPEPRPPFVQPKLTMQEHVEAAERILKHMHGYYGNFDNDHGGCSSPEVYGLMAIAHALVAIARKP